VLCEKPLGLSTAQVRELIEVRDRTGLQAGEAFMVRTHPQWLRVKQLVDGGTLGPLRLVQAWFSYDNRNPANVRNVAEYGGGGVMDIGCYPIFIARFLFGTEPRQVKGLVEYDPQFKTDRLASGLLDFPTGQCVFSCSTQLVPAQRVMAFCERGQIEVEIPFNAPPDAATRIWVNGVEEQFDICDQYGLEADAFTRAVRGEGPVPVTLESALGNMAVIEALLGQRP
jgi:predicted dehydrogenase